MLARLSVGFEPEKKELLSEKASEPLSPCESFELQWNTAHGNNGLLKDLDPKKNQENNPACIMKDDSLHKNELLDLLTVENDSKDNENKKETDFDILNKIENFLYLFFSKNEKIQEYVLNNSKKNDGDFKDSNIPALVPNDGSNDVDISFFLDKKLEKIPSSDVFLEDKFKDFLKDLSEDIKINIKNFVSDFDFHEGQNKDIDIDFLSSKIINLLINEKNKENEFISIYKENDINKDNFNEYIVEGIKKEFQQDNSEKKEISSNIHLPENNNRPIFQGLDTSFLSYRDDSSNTNLNSKESENVDNKSINTTIDRVVHLTDQLKISNGSSASLRIDDNILGKIQLHLEMKNSSQVKVIIVAENDETRKKIEERIDNLKSSLESRHITLSEFRVEAMEKPQAQNFNQHKNQDGGEQNAFSGSFQSRHRHKEESSSTLDNLKDLNNLKTNKKYPAGQKNSAPNIQRSANGSLKVLA